MNIMADQKVVLVTGGTGSQGGATVTHLLQKKKVRVRVLTRNLESPKAKSLAARGVELVKGDYEDGASLKAALAGVSAAFSVQQWTEKGGPEKEERDGKRFADAVKAAGSPHLVYSSAEGAERNSGLHHYESKWAIEQHIHHLNLPVTILRPVGFMDSFGLPPMKLGMALGMFRAAFGPTLPVQFVATYDIGWFAARALEDPDAYAGRVIPLAGDKLSVNDIIKTFKAVTGKKPWVAPIPKVMTKMVPKEFGDMFTWIREKGFAANIAENRKENPDMLTFAAWLKKYTAENR
jgi:uncharacterized protein YbjT (DUF2867 family)